MKKTVLFCLIVLCASALRFYHLEQKEYWLDEVCEIYIAKNSSSVKELLAIQSHKDNHIAAHPPLSHIFRYFSLKIKDNEFFGRLPSVLFAIATVVLIFFVARRWFSTDTGLVSALLLTFSPFHLFYSQEARPYALFIFFSTLSLYLFSRALFTKKGNNLLWTGYIITCAFLLYTHYFSFLVLGTQAILFFIFTLICLKKETDRFITPWWKYGIVIFFIFLTYLPWLRAFFIHTSVKTGELLTMPSLSPSFFIMVLYQLIGCTKKALFWYALFFIIGGLSLKKDKKQETILCVSFIGIAFFSVFIALKLGNRFYNPRYFIFLLPLILSVVSKGIVETIQYLYNTVSQPCILSQGATVLGGVILLLPLLLNPIGLKKYYNTPKRPWRTIIADMDKNMRKGDIILTEAIPLMYYLGEKEVFLDPADILFKGKKITLSSDIKRIQNNNIDIIKRKRIWYLTGASNTPLWVKQNFSKIKEYEGLVGRFYLYVNFDDVSL